MTDTLFLLECHVSTITFDPTYSPFPTMKQIVINLKFADILNTLVSPTEFEELINMDEEGGTLTLDTGTSYLFSYGPNNLISALKQRPLEIVLRVNSRKEATAIVKWTDNFREMVKLFQRIGMVSSVDYDAETDFINKADEVIGRINVFIRLSCFGYSIETKFCKKTEEDKRDYFFKNPKSANTFKCEEYGSKISIVVPIANLYNPAHKNTLEGDVLPADEVLSWSKIFGRSDSGPKLPHDQLEKKEGGEDIRRVSVIPLTEIFLQSSADAVSICFRPPENRFMDFLNMVSAEVSNTGNDPLVTINQRKRTNRIEYVEEHHEEEEEDGLMMTAQKINKKLCKNKDCPAALKFKEFGIGPLATGKGLGTLYGDVEPPVEYGLSHTYGSMSNYGPYGVFSRPKRLDEPFVPPKSAIEPPRPPCSNRKETACKPKGKKGEKKRCCGEVLRLRGGGSSDVVSDSTQDSVKEFATLARDPATGPKSPFLECKSVMNQFDEILAAYKRALGPCGEATCPYAQNLAEESCKKLCDQLAKAVDKSESISCKSIPCGLDVCPYKEKSSYPAGCGSAKCAYTKYKLGLVDDDAALELQFLPPAVSGKCGHPKCQYLVQPPLPPIHWDCPNPLPKGNCKNPNCPYLPPDLKKLKCPPPKKGPCGSPDCPYALPPPCELPTCPFRPQPCPFADQANNKCCPTEDDSCENPDCPFGSRAPQKVCSSDSDLKGQFTSCGSPDCPLANKPKKKKKKKKKKTPPCANPSCPFAPKPIDDICDNPECPLAQKAKTDICENPECPLAQKPKLDLCENPKCPLAQKQKKKPKKNVCENPDCPFAEPDGEEEEELSICSNPECPLARKAKKKKKKMPDTCDNPDCPYNQESSEESSESVCSNPACPLAPKLDPICNDPFCPYMQPLPSCGIPNCPYEPIPVMFVDRSKLKCFKPKPAPCGAEERVPPPPAPPLRIADGDVKTEPTVAGESAEGQKKLGDGDGRKNSEKGKKEPDAEKQKEKARGNGKKGGGGGKRKNRGKFVYSIGDKYPGVKIGHRECVTPLFHVPAKMGWLWNINSPPILSLKPRRGWKPGATPRSIAAKIKAHRQARGLGMPTIPKFKRHKKGRHGGVDDSGSEMTVSPKPTLQIQKKDGAYWITMNPLKDPSTLAENENPYMECTPMQFRITKNKKKNEDENGSKLCTCEDVDDSSSSSDSELDIEFTPPAGIINPLRFKKKKDIVHSDTQYDPKDFQVKKDKGGKGKGKKGKGKKGKK